MSAIDDLNNAITTEVALISDTLNKAKAAYVQESYIAALTKQTALEANEITSYSIGGRSFTYRDVQAGASAVAALESELAGLIYGTSRLIDMNTGTSQT